MQTVNVNRRTEQYDVAFAMKPWQICLKRGFDIIGGIVGLVLSSPFLICSAIALKIQGDGSIIYSQERIGQNGKPFVIYKFRSMRENAELDENAEVDIEDDVKDTVQEETEKKENGTPRLAEPDDERLTPVGAFLRKHHLDELPQFWNVIKGDMSLVGYRPERQYFIDKIMQEDSRYRCLYQIRPGVTSEATIYNGYTNNMEQMLERLNMDLRYLETASLWKDFIIMCKTFVAMV